MRSTIISSSIALQVLFTIAKEKLINSWKYGMAVLLLDVLQVFCAKQSDLVAFDKTSMLCTPNWHLLPQTAHKCNVVPAASCLQSGGSLSMDIQQAQLVMLRACKIQNLSV